MSDWTLTHDGVTKALAGWGMTGCVISEPSFNSGMFTAQIPGAMTASVPWGFKDTVLIQRGDVVEWRGTVLNDVRQGEGFTESVQCRFTDPWWWLGQAAYTQAWWDAATLSAYAASRVALFAEISAGTGWSPRSIGAEIAAIIAHCNALHDGGKMQLGTLSGDGFSVTPTPQRLENVTHEGALRRALQWVPDAIPSWDHTTDPPTLNITQRATATARSYVFCDGQVMMSQQITRRQDLAVTGVRIIYSGVDALGNPTAIVDAAGESSGSGVVETVINLAGGAGGGAPSTPTVQPAVEQNYSVESEEIDLADVNWWFKYADLGIDDVSQINAVALSNMDVAPDTGHTSLGGCTKHWLSGGVPESLAAAHTRIALVSAVVRTTRTMADSEVDVTLEVSEARWVRMLVPTTNLSGEYVLTVREASVTMPGGTGSALGTSAPTGVAAKLLAAWSQAQYDGALRVTKSECDEAVRLGDVVNWTGNLVEWETMRAQVQQLTRNIDTGTTEIALGVADHLALDDFAKLLKMVTIAPALDLQQQAQGTTPTGEPDATEINELLAPQGLTCSVGDVVATWSRYTSHKEYTFNGDESTVEHKDLDTEDQVITTPASVTVENTASSDKTVTTPAKTKHTDSDNNSQELTPTGLKLMNASGYTLELSVANGLVITKGSSKLEASIEGGVVLTKDGHTSKLTDLQLLLDNGAGLTNSITEEQMVISGDDKMGVYEAFGLSFDDGSSSVSLDLTDVLQAEIDGDTLSAAPTAVRMESGDNVAELSPAAGLLIEDAEGSTTVDAEHIMIEIGDDSAEVSPAGGFEAISTGYTGHLSPGDGLHLAGPGGGTVDIATIDGQAISLQDTDGCDVDIDGEPVTHTAPFLRGDFTT